MRPRTLPPSRPVGTAAEGRGDEDDLELRFRTFRQVATAFTRSLAGSGDFNHPLDRSRASERNLEIARSIFGKWSLDILILLASERVMGFSDLRRALRGISSRILSSKLKLLESRGLIQRKVVASRPPRVQYRLTDEGMTTTRLGEPVLLYLRHLEGRYRRVPSGPRLAAVPRSASSTAR